MKPGDDSPAALGEPPREAPFQDKGAPSGSGGCSASEAQPTTLSLRLSSYPDTAEEKGEEDWVTKGIKHKTCKMAVRFLSHGWGWEAFRTEVQGEGGLGGWLLLTVGCLLLLTGVPCNSPQGLPSFPTSFLRWV